MSEEGNKQTEKDQERNPGCRHDRHMELGVKFTIRFIVRTMREFGQCGIPCRSGHQRIFPRMLLIVQILQHPRTEGREAQQKQDGR